MKIKIHYLLFFVFTSCSVFFPEGITFNSPNYSFNYLSFNKKLDYDGTKTYLLNPTNFKGSSLRNGTELADIVNFFKDKLGEKVSKTRDYRDKQGKIKIPFIIKYNITNEEITFLKENTSFNYLILTKIMYLEELKENPVDFRDKRKFYKSRAGARSFIKILDIKNNNVLLEMSCSGEVSISENRDLDTGELKLSPISIHKDSYSLGEKTMKKLLKKIK